MQERVFAEQNPSGLHVDRNDRRERMLVGNKARGLGIQALPGHHRADTGIGKDFQYDRMGDRAV